MRRKDLLKIEKVSLISTFLDRGGGSVVSVLAFYFDKPRSNPTKNCFTMDLKPFDCRRWISIIIHQERSKISVWNMISAKPRRHHQVQYREQVLKNLDIVYAQVLMMLDRSIDPVCQIQLIKLYDFLKNRPTPASVLFLSELFKQKKYNFNNKSMWKNVISI